MRNLRREPARCLQLVLPQSKLARLGFRAGDFPEAERYYSGAISLPLHPRLTDAECDHVVATLKEALV